MALQIIDRAAMSLAEMSAAFDNSSACRKELRGTANDSSK